VEFGFEVRFPKGQIKAGKLIDRSGNQSKM
jgi:hypothetical protein